MYLLDTNHCSRLLDGHPAIVAKCQEIGDVPVATCVIVRGELMFMAYKSERRDENLTRVQGFLNDIDIFPVDDQAADAYGRLKAAIIDHFGPKERAQRRRAEVEKLGFKENDLWIAAIAKRNGFTIVSTDDDFNRMKEVDNLSVESWLPSVQAIDDKAEP